MRDLNKSTFLLSLIVLVGSLLSCVSKKQTLKSDSCSFNVTFTSSYCGGMRPPESLVDSLKTERTFSKGELVILSTDKKEYRLALNLEGKGALLLPNGEYEVFLKEKVSPENISDDQRCVEWSTTPEFTFVVNSGMAKNISFKLHKYCNPCELPAP